METKELKVSAIENGTVIDHIPVESLFKVLYILNLEKHQNLVLFGSNLESKKMGVKAIIKIANRFFHTEEINKISIVAPTATLTIIRNYQVVEKSALQIPDSIRTFIKCINPKCITNHESVSTIFNVIDKNPNNLQLKCHYCEKITSQQNMEFTL